MKFDVGEPTLLTVFEIETDKLKAVRVRNSINKISERALELIQRVFLSCAGDKEMRILRFLLKLYDEGKKAVYSLGDEVLSPLLKAEKHLISEQHLLLGFIRFSDYGGILGATITPKNFILPFIAKHFVLRYPNEKFVIFDKTNNAALFYEDRKTKIIPVEAIDFPEVSEAEKGYRELWKSFYHTIAISSRENEKCRMTHMPKRYWENMTEMKELL